MGQRKKELLTHHRYGIHACHDAFGIAVAEMVDAGCIVFVPEGGGQVEIVNHPELIFADDADAVDKILAVLASEAKQESLRTHLVDMSQRFSATTFMGIMRRTVADFLASQTVK